MTSVTGRIKQIKQPRGGYLKPSDLKICHLDDNKYLNENENMSPIIVGLAVDYLTRFIVCHNNDAFFVSFLGAKIVGEHKKAMSLYEKIHGLDDDSIICACKLVGFDSAYRAGIHAYSPIEFINPDNQTIENIRIMVERCAIFIKKYGPIIKNGFTFENGGYSKLINSGDGDFVTRDTLWDFKVSKNHPTKDHTLQLIIYYIMGKHTPQSIFKEIKNVGIFNPRLNNVYIFDLSKLSKEIVLEIEKNVIGY